MVTPLAADMKSFIRGFPHEMSATDTSLVRFHITPHFICSNITVKAEVGTYNEQDSKQGGALTTASATSRPGAYTGLTPLTS